MGREMPAPLKPRLLALVARGQAIHDSFVAGLSAAERDATGAPDRWTAKDEVVHVVAWKGQAARLLDAAARGETPAPAPDETAYNPQVYAAWRDRAWADVVAETSRVDAALTAAIESCAEADLGAPDRFPWLHGRPLSNVVSGNGFAHPVEHYANYCASRGDPAQAEALRHLAAGIVLELFGESRLYGYQLYNLACFYATTIRRDAALEQLRAALTHAPDLRDWAGDDPDFASLHGDPAFEALRQG